MCFTGSEFFIIFVTIKELIMSQRIFSIFSFIISLFIGFSATAQEKVSATDWINQQEDPMIASVNFMNMDRFLPKMESDETLNDNMQLIADLLDEAHKHIGTGYRRGGKTPKGFDCSGFTGYVFRQFGMQLGASSRDQYLQGLEISNDEIQPGDLLFFKGRSARQVGHVGIAVKNDPKTGEITFIHSATSGGVRLDRVSAPYYSKRFMGARRIITE